MIEIDQDLAERPSTVRFSTVISTATNDFVQSTTDRIQLDYNGRGQLSALAQSRGDGTWDRDTVAFEYDGYGNLTSFDQEIPWFSDATNGLGVTASIERSFDYAWERSATSGPSHIRLASNTYPDSTSLTYSYGGTINSPISRVTSLTYGGTLVASYAYLGMERLATTHYVENSVYSTLRNPSGDFDALDRFNRITRSRWNRTRTTNEVPFYDTTVYWDDGSNVTGITDHVFDSDFNFVYANDELDRLTQVKRGDGDGAAITSLLGQEDWTLSKIGNWDEHDLDLNGDLNYTDHDITVGDPRVDPDDEYRSQNSFSTINEQSALGLDTDNDGTVEITNTRTYDDNGNLVLDPSKNHRYKWDVLGRLVEIHDTSGSSDVLIADFMYNALNYRIAERVDSDDDGSLSDENWTRFIYDARWRVIAAYEIDPVAETEVIRERHVHHAAGLDGVGTASYIDEVVLRDNDPDGDGTLDERHYYCQSWRADVVAIIDHQGRQVEHIRYSAYGVPYSIPMADKDRNGTIEVTPGNPDVTAQANAISAAYDVWFDNDLDGDVDFTDLTLWSAQAAAIAADGPFGRGVLSGYKHNRGHAGYWREAASGLANVRYRWFDANTGIWLSPDPSGYPDGPNLFAYGVSAPVVGADPRGLGWLRFLDDAYDKWIDYGTGIADSLTFGATKYIREETPVRHLAGGEVDYSSGWHRAGKIHGIVGGVVATGGGGAAASSVKVVGGRYYGQLHFGLKWNKSFLHALGVGRIKILVEPVRLIPMTMYGIRIPTIWSIERMLAYASRTPPAKNCLTAVFRMYFFPFFGG